MLGISAWDWAALTFYFVLITGLGLYMARKVSDTSDFFMAGRRFGRTFMVFFAFGAGTSGNDAVGVSSKTFTSGLSGIWWQWLWLFCTPFYWLIAPILRRMRCLTTGDYFEVRYDSGVAGLYSIIGVMQLTVTIGIVQLGASSMIEAVTGGAIPKNYAMLVMTVLFVAYGMAGGLAAAIVTDFIQGILTVILSFMLLPFALKAVGGFAGLHEKIDDPSMFSLIAPGEINGFYISMLCISALIGIVTQPHIMGVCAAGRTEMDGRIGFAGGNLLKRFCTVAWTVVGLCAVVMYMGEDIHPDMVYGQVAKDLLPTVMPGLVGVFIAALIASVMSSCDAFMVSSSGLFTQNFYRRWLVTNAEEGHYVLVGRIAALLIVVVGVGFAFLVDDVPSGLLWFFKLQALMGAAFWIGLFWRRATVAAAWASVAAGILVWFFTSTAAFHAFAAGEVESVGELLALEEGIEEVQFAAFADQTGLDAGEIAAWSSPGPAQSFWESATPETMLPATQMVTITEPGLPASMVWDGKFRDSWQIFVYLGTAFFVCIAVSLVTPRVKKEKLDRVYAALHTPVHENEPHDPRPFTLPEGLEPTPANKLINHPDFEIPKPTLVGMAGFFFFWFWVVALIAFVFWMVTWGVE